jgi:glycerate kinase
MNILICPDKFKDCLKAQKVALHIQNGILKVFPDAQCKIFPMADGGEGTVEALVESTNGHIEKVKVHDPLMRKIDSFFGISGDNETAFIEMSAASGMALLKPEERNPMIASTFGTGELIRFALDKGVKEIIVGIGGSATIDGGMGMAQALGISITDDTGWETEPGAISMGRIFQINLKNLDPRIAQCKIYAACDVSNPLTGPSGAANVFGPQKGANPYMVMKLDAHLKHLSQIIRKQLHTEVEEMPGAGAAGGLGAGIVAFLKGTLNPGFELISRIAGLDEWINWADLVITGEGKIDFQTAFGKTPSGVARMAKIHNKPVIAFTGAIGEIPVSSAFDAVISIPDKPMTLEQSVADAGRLLENAAERVFSLLALGKRLQSLRPIKRKM